MASAPARVFKSHLKAKNLQTQPRTVTAATVTLSDKLHNGGWTMLDKSAGVAVTLPAATGSGAHYKLLVKTASNATTIAVTGDDTFVGGYLCNDSGDTTAATADFFPAAAGNNRLTLTTVGGGGLAGDWLEFVDYAADKWMVRGVFTGAADPSNRFSTV
jgi:hypothetical protein